MENLRFHNKDDIIKHMYQKDESKMDKFFRILVKIGSNHRFNTPFSVFTSLRRKRLDDKHVRILLCVFELSPAGK